MEWNIRGLWCNYNDLALEVSERQPLILALQETLFMGTDNRSQNLLKDYEWRFQADQTLRHRNVVCLAVHQDTTFSFIDLQTPLPAVAVTMKHPIAATFVSLYLSPQMTPQEVEEQLRALLNELPQPVILMGDFNAHSVIWGSSTTDRKGIKIEELLASHDLSILNNGDHTRLDSTSGKTSAIDLTIVSNRLVSKFQWSVNADTAGSDHFPIRLTSSMHSPKLTAQRRWKYGDADWQSFERIIEQSTPGDREVSLNEFEDIVRNAAEQSIPRTSGKLGRKAVPWWNNEVATAINSEKKTTTSTKTESRRRS